MIARRIEERVLEIGGGSVRDDVAVVVLRVGPGVERAVCRRRAGGSRFAVKLLVLTPEPIDAAAAALDPRRGGRGRRGAGGLAGLERVEGRLLGLGLRRGDRARPRRRRRRRSSASRRRASTRPATPARASPSVAIQDALATFAGRPHRDLLAPRGRPRLPRGRGAGRRGGPLRRARSRTRSSRTAESGT